MGFQPMLSGCCQGAGDGPNATVNERIVSTVVSASRSRVLRKPGYFEATIAVFPAKSPRKRNASFRNKRRAFSFFARSSLHNS